MGDLEKVEPVEDAVEGLGRDGLVLMEVGAKLFSDGEQCLFEVLDLGQ